jgi:CubicO group peptidase (beta-lactamase class C family)
MESLEHYIEEQRTNFKVKGIGVAVVKEGEVVLSKGFGDRDAERGLPVTPETIFSIGSSSKAFTATLIGALVDDGLLEWDKPVRHYLPWFAMFDKTAGEQMTPRDLLCHRSGLPRHDLLWYNNQDADRAELIRRLPHLENSRGFREVWQYNNLMFLTAGYLAGELLGLSWEDAVQQRLLDPLGMTNTNFSVLQSQKSEDFSLPYSEKDDDAIEIPFRPIDLVGPAGSINSSITDMTKWVSAQVNGGRAGDRQVISPSALSQLHAPTMVMPEGPSFFDEAYGTGYALGWFLESYRGFKLVHHGGNIDGFSALVAFLPKQQIGIVALTNMNGSSLPMVAAYRAIDELLGLEPIPWGERYKTLLDTMKAGAKESKAHAEAKTKAAPPSHPLEDYAGDYTHPGYGNFDITLVDGKLVPHYNALDFTMEHKHYDIWNARYELFDMTLPLSFGTDLEGNIATLTAPLEPSVKPIVFQKQAAKGLSDPSVLSRYTGSYSMGPMTIVVDVERDTVLVATIAGQGKAELVPYEERIFTIKGQEATTVEFVLAANGSVEKVVLPGAVFTPTPAE